MDLDETTYDSLVTWGVPGASVVVVKEGALTRPTGYGMADAFSRQPVTPDTIFSIASCTKAFVATACAQLIEDGRLEWDHPVRRHVSDFRMCDPLADAEVTLRDLLCHRTGLGRQDLLWYRAPWGIDELLRRLPFLELSAPFRSRCDYNNLLYLILGRVISAAAGEPWSDFIWRRLFKPLGMTRSAFTSSEVDARVDVAKPHRMTHGGLQLWADVEETAVRASGSIKSCARDLGAWLIFLLSGGISPSGQRLLCPVRLGETHTPQILHPPLELMSRNAGTIFSSYALGWHVLDYRGHLLIENSGRFGGFRVHVAFMPRRCVGLAVLANLRHTGMATAVSRRLLDGLVGLLALNWDQYYLEEDAARQAIERDRVREQELHRRLGTSFALDLIAYCGTYRDRAYGDAVIEADESAESLYLRWSTFRIRLENYHYNVFTTQEDDPDAENPIDSLIVVFCLGALGEVAHLEFLDRKFKRREYAAAPACRHGEQHDLGPA
jgi:CubicO group peptidase (beta-lactamase class C family)